MDRERTILLDADALPYLPGVVELHLAQLSGGFMTSLGERFLLEVFRNITRSSHGVALVALAPETGDTVEGFLCGATDTAKLYRDFVLRHGLKAGALAAPRLVSLGVFRKIFETLRYPAQRADLDAPAAELLDLAVVDAAKGTGLAQSLFDAFVAELAVRGHRSFRVTTGSALTRAHRFYEKQGAVRLGTIEIHRGESTVVYAYHGSTYDSDDVEHPA